MPEHLKRSMTEHHTRFTLRTGVPVFFCDSHSPWQCGRNEKTNGLLWPESRAARRRFEEALDAVAARLNGRPRQTPGFSTPLMCTTACCFDCLILPPHFSPTTRYLRRARAGPFLAGLFWLGRQFLFHDALTG